MKERNIVVLRGNQETVAARERKVLPQILRASFSSILFLPRPQERVPPPLSFSPIMFLRAGYVGGKWTPGPWVLHLIRVLVFNRPVLPIRSRSGPVPPSASFGHIALFTLESLTPFYQIFWSFRFDSFVPPPPR